MKRKLLYLLPIAVCFLLIAAKPLDTDSLRARAQKLANDGNVKESYELYRKLLLERKVEGSQAGIDLYNATYQLQRLHRQDELDALWEDAVEANPQNWRLLQAVAQAYNRSAHYGYIISGKYKRGHHRGGNAKVVNSYERDRVRALQLMAMALPMVEQDKDQYGKRAFYQQFAMMLLGNRYYNEAWRLQYKTDLATLPDYEEGWGHRYGYRRSNSRAPVDVDGNPVFYEVPKSFEAASSDGERWRYMLMMQTELGHDQSAVYADFLQRQFGVQTLRAYGRWFYRDQDEDDVDRESSITQLHKLDDNETVAQLATGIKRFKLPDEHNFIKIYQKQGNDRKLAEIYQNRRQYIKAAAHLRKILARSPKNKSARHQLDQIEKNWGRFEPGKPQPAGKGATVDFRFRNGTKVSFTAYKVELHTLLKDVKDYLKSNPRKLDWQQWNVGNIGYRLVHENHKKYIGDKLAEWSLDLVPRPWHFDKRITVTTPLQKAGVYLLTAKMNDGNTSRIIVWLNDTAIITKNLDGKTLYYVADAVTGKPIADAKVEFFGYYQEYVGRKIVNKVTRRQYDIHTKEFTRTSDGNGQIILGPEVNKPRNYSWVAIARKGDRLAYLGFQRIWSSSYHRRNYSNSKTFIITDRPVYRPGQRVKFKAWTAHARYDLDNRSTFAGGSFSVRIQNPKGEKVYNQNLKADEYGGYGAEFTLPKDATLGMYSIRTNRGHLQFRVEEYKKPEFEVTIDAPDKPVKLGDKVPVTIRANYYFGAPVVNAKVKIKVLRNAHDAIWRPFSRWDWFYGPGYWWFSYDYPWYPGWRYWGCKAPWPWWINRPSPQPEVVIQQESLIQPDGTVKIEIDTSIAKALHGDTDHRYSITAEVTDSSRRAIVGAGSVIVTREPYKVYCWLDRGYCNVGDDANVSFFAQTADGKPVDGKATIRLLKISYDENGKPTEKEVRLWEQDLGDDGRGTLRFQASEPGQYRFSCTVADDKGNKIEGGQIFVIRGDEFHSGDFRFAKLELIPDKRDYKPGETVKLMVNADRRNTTILLFVRPVNGVCPPPKVIRLDGKSHIEEIPVTKADMPNFFVEALTIYGGEVHTLTKEIAVPPEKRVLNIAVEPSATEYKPGEKAKVKVKLTDFFGEPFAGSVVMSIYDKAVEYISGGSNVPEIRAFFWKWRRHHSVRMSSSLQRAFHNLLKEHEITLQNLGVFGDSVADLGLGEKDLRRASIGRSMKKADAAPAAALVMEESAVADDDGGGAPAEPVVEPTIRKNFADTAYWNGTITTDERGEAEIELTMPENLTSWKIRTWGLGRGTRVGESAVEVVTTKNLLLRLQAPRFFVEKDEVVLSANVHNYLKTAKRVKVVLEVNDCLKLMHDNATQVVEVPADGEKRVDWRVIVRKEGDAMVRMKALTDEESDGMEMSFPAKVHGAPKTESFSGHMRPDANTASITFSIPKERRVDESRLEVRYSPTLAGAMVDALPYLVSYPYGCTEQTLNRFVPTVLTQKVLLDMGLDLKDIRDKMTNLNAQEIGDDKERAEQWKKKGRRVLGVDADGNPVWSSNPVFDEATVREMVSYGVKRLASMQLSDGGWGWFSGWREHSYPHTTATVVHGLQVARENDAMVPEDVLKRGIEWLRRYQEEQVRMIKDKKHWKKQADNLDALIYMVLTDNKVRNAEMHDFLYRDRKQLSVYAKCMIAMAFHKVGDAGKTSMVQRNIEQFLVTDPENQTAYLKLGNGNYWWYWYGSEYEAHAYYLKLLARVEPKSDKAAWLVKYLLNNRKHATYWNSTRDTALCIEAMADYMRASGEDKPDMTLEVWLDGKRYKEVTIDKSNIFTFDNKFVLTGDDVTTGKHTLEFRRKGSGPLYFNAYSSYFSLEDHITRAGLEVKVNRKYFKLTPVDKSIKVSGSRGQALDQKVEKYERHEIQNLDEVTSGDLLEIELTIESKNDYEYLIFEDMKAAGCEPFKVRSGYTRNGMTAYMELRDDKVCFFVRALPRGTHSIAYRMRAELPGKFSALRTQAYAMYAPELRGNSDEIKIRIKDIDTRKQVTSVLSHEQGPPQTDEAGL